MKTKKLLQEGNIVNINNKYILIRYKEINKRGRNYYYIIKKFGKKYYKPSRICKEYYDIYL